MVGSAEKTANLKTFVQWTAKHITGDEKGEAQVFLDRLFQGFGWEGFKEANAVCELRVKNTNGGTSFADLVWKTLGPWLRIAQAPWARTGYVAGSPE